MTGKLIKASKALFLILLFLFTASLTLAAQTYNSGTYGSGAYGKAVCGDSVCDASESCSSCSSDCGSCATSAASSGGGGGGGGGGGSFAKFFGEETISTHIWNSIKAGSTATMKINKKDISFTRLDIIVKNNLGTVEIKVEKLPNNPVLVEPTETKVYQYLSVDKVNIEDLDISKVIFKFDVDEKWLEDNNVDRNSIVLKIFRNNEWKDLPTKLIPENKVMDIISNYVSYEAESATLSYFAVSIKETVKEKMPVENVTLACTESWECTSWSECLEGKRTSFCNDLNNCGSIVDKPLETEDCIVSFKKLPGKIFNLKWLSLSLILIIVLVVGYYTIHSFLQKKVIENKIKFEKISKSKLKQLENYIKTSLTKGYSKRRIKKELIQNGWPKNIVEKEFEKIK